MEAGPRILVVGTGDTKGEELGFLCGRLLALGRRPMLLDCATGGEPSGRADVRPEEIAAAAGHDLAALRQIGDRGTCVAAMAEGAAALARSLHALGRVEGVIGAGGSAGTTIATAAMRALPLGLPKVMVSTLASGDTRPYVQSKDICLLYSVVDMAGLNRVSRRILANAAAAVAGMAAAATSAEAAPGDRPLVAASMFGVTTPCVTRARQVLEGAGFEVLVFHATGSGGRTLEELAAGGFLAGVLDITTTELADELVGGVLSAGPGRLEAAGAAGIPQVVAPGAIDMVNFGPLESIPGEFKGRRFHRHNPTVTLMRTTPSECRELGRITAAKLSRARGPAVLLFPRGGVSALDRDGQPFDDPASRDAYLEGVRSALVGDVRLEICNEHINDPGFAEHAARTLLSLIRDD